MNTRLAAIFAALSLAACGGGGSIPATSSIVNAPGNPASANGGTITNPPATTPTPSPVPVTITVPVPTPTPTPNPVTSFAPSSVTFAIGSTATFTVTGATLPLVAIQLNCVPVASLPPSAPFVHATYVTTGPQSVLVTLTATEAQSCQAFAVDAIWRYIGPVNVTST